MPSFPPITVRQPRPHGVVDDPVEVCRVGAGFEAQLAARVRDGNGAELARVSMVAGGTGVWGNYHAELPIDTIPATAHGTLEVYGNPSQGTRIFGANRDQILDPDLIFPGQTLRIPQ